MTWAHFRVRSRYVPREVRLQLSHSVGGWRYGSILRLLRVQLLGEPHPVAEVLMYHVRLDPATDLPCVFTDGAQRCWLALTRMGPTVALGRGAPGFPVTGANMWTVLTCAASAAHCTPTQCVCGAH